MQRETLEPSQRYKLVYPVHAGAFIAIVAPESVRNYSGYDRTTER
jgi:hypothetical protein